MFSYVMIVVNDSEQVGQVLAAVTEMNHYFDTKSSVLGMPNDRINTVKNGYGDQVHVILDQGTAFDERTVTERSHFPKI